MARGRECAGCGEVFQTRQARIGHEARCQRFHERQQLLRDTILSKENLERLYITERKSVLDIQQELGLDSWGPIYRAMERHGIPRRPFTESNSLDSSREKRVRTLMEKTGYPHNFCKGSPSREAWEARLLEEEGIMNVFQRPEVIAKIGRTLAEKYPDEDPRSSHFVRGRRVVSKPHRRVLSLVEALGYSARVEKKFFCEGENRILYSFDIFVRPNLLVEVNGDFWHSNPKIYRPTDLIPDPTNPLEAEITVARKWELDKKKIEFAESAGYEVLVVWESELEDLPSLGEKLADFLATGVKDGQNL